jgi:hypothetical protein
LVGHLKDNGTFAARRGSFSEIPVLMNNVERVDCIIQYFKLEKTTRPAKRKTLETHIQALFGRALSPTELADTISALITRKALEFTPTDGIVYRL